MQIVLSYLLWLLPPLPKVIGLNHFSSSTQGTRDCFFDATPSNQCTRDWPPNLVLPTHPSFSPQLIGNFCWKAALVSPPIQNTPVTSLSKNVPSLPIFIKLPVPETSSSTLAFRVIYPPFTPLTCTKTRIHPFTKRDNKVNF